MATLAAFTKSGVIAKNRKFTGGWKKTWCELSNGRLYTSAKAGLGTTSKKGMNVATVWIVIANLARVKMLEHKGRGTWRYSNVPCESRVRVLNVPTIGGFLLVLPYYSCYPT